MPFKERTWSPKVGYWLYYEGTEIRHIKTIHSDGAYSIDIFNEGGYLWGRASYDNVSGLRHEPDLEITKDQAEAMIRLWGCDVSKL